MRGHLRKRIDEGLWVEVHDGVTREECFEVIKLVCRGIKRVGNSRDGVVGEVLVARVGSCHVGGVTPHAIIRIDAEVSEIAQIKPDDIGRCGFQVNT